MHKITHPEHGEARCGEWQLELFLSLGWRVAGAKPERAPSTVAEAVSALDADGAFQKRLEKLHGIGASLARKISHACVPKTEAALLDIIDNDPERLIDISGVTGHTLDSIKDQLLGTDPQDAEDD